MKECLPEINHFLHGMEHRDNGDAICPLPPIENGGGIKIALDKSVILNITFRTFQENRWAST